MPRLRLPLALVIGTQCVAACHPSETTIAAATVPVAVAKPVPVPAAAVASSSSSGPVSNEASAPAAPTAPAAVSAIASSTRTAPVAADVAQPSKRISRSDDCSNDPNANLQRGRKLAGAGKWEEAVLAYDPGVHRAPGDPVLRAERGYALYKVGLLAEAVMELELAVGLTDDRDLQSAIHFNLGLALTALGQDDKARLHFSSAAERGNAAARKRLGEASRCRASWQAHPKLGPAPLANNLRELAAAREFINCPDHPKPATEAEAEALLCRGCGGGSWNDDSCGLSFPLTVADGYMHLHSFQFRAEEFPSRAHPYIYFHDRLDEVEVAKAPVWKVSGPYLVLESFSIDWYELDDGVGHLVFNNGSPVYTVDDSSDPNATTTGCAPDVGAAEANQSHGGGALWGYGVPWRRVHSVDIYSIATRQPLLGVEAEDGELEWRIRGKELLITGATCQETIPIPDVS